MPFTISGNICEGLKPPVDLHQLSADFFYHRQIKVWQFRRGFRFAIDAPLLAAFLEKSAEPALEVGAGCGIISLLAIFRNLFPKIIALEIQFELAQLAAFNITENGFTERIEIINHDFRFWQNSQKFAVIFANPPYFPLNQGHLNPSVQKRLAKFEVTLSLAELLTKSREIIQPEGSLYLISLARREEETLVRAKNSGFGCELIRRIKPFSNAKVERVLFKFRPFSTELKELPPLIIFEREGKYSAELEPILSGG